jgi:hypothetical protein
MFSLKKHPSRKFVSVQHTMFGGVSVIPDII